MDIDYYSSVLDSVSWINLLQQFLSNTALAIYSRSPAAFRAVRSLGILQLPCSKEIRRIISKNADEPGINEVYLQKQSDLFKQFCKETMNRGKREPLGVGALIWDETKVSVVVIAVHVIKSIIAIPCPIDTYLQCIIFNSQIFQGFNYYNPVPLH